MKKILLFFSLCLALGANAQTVTFDKKDYLHLGVYDTWEESPFRTGQLEGNCSVTRNPLRNSDNNSKKVLGFQRSRFGSNTFGARINLKEPFALTSKLQYVHVKLLKPKSGRVMLIGLGKRLERSGQSPEPEQFWVFSTTPVTTNCWNDAVFPIKGHDGIEIHSLVLVPDCESTHELASDFACYIDDIEVNYDDTPRIHIELLANDESNSEENNTCSIHDANRNGEILTPDGLRLSSLWLTAGRDFTIKMIPERGFTYDGIIIRNGKEEVRIDKTLFHNDCYTIPAKLMHGNIEVEGLFVELHD